MIRTLLFGLSMSMSICASASEAMIYVAAYQCNAKAVNQDMVRSCSTAFPDLAAHANEAYKAWLARNSVKADAAESACKQPALPDASGDTQNQVDKVRAMVVEVTKEIARNFQERIRKEGKSTCDEALDQMQSGRALMDIQ